MNEIKAVVTNIQTVESLNIVSFDYKGQKLSMMSLSLKDIDVGTSVILSINPSHIAIGKDLKGDISLSNRFDCRIKELKQGELLSCLELLVNDDLLTSIITSNSVKRMNLKEGVKVQALVKASELSIKKVITK